MVLCELRYEISPLERLERVISGERTSFVTALPNCKSNDMQFHHLHDLNESYHLKGPPSSQLYHTVSKSNDMKFDHLNNLNESYQLKGPPSSQFHCTVSKSNDMKFHHLNDLNESYQLREPLSHSCTRL